jgi:hypothetical protein
VPQTANTKIVTFADDTAIMEVGENIKEATDKLQQAINAVNSWTKQWRIILNKIKSFHMNFRKSWSQSLYNSYQICRAI